MIISNSEIRTADRCPRKWWLIYYRHLIPRRPDVAGPLPLGTGVHLALEHSYTTGVNPADFFAKERAFERLRLLEESARAAEAGEDFRADLARFDKDTELGRIMLAGYLDWVEESGADEHLEIVSAEQSLGHEILPGVELVGKLDIQARNTLRDELLFLDHKTCQSIEQASSLVAVDTQTLTYQVLQKLTGAPRVAVGGMLNLLRKVKRTSTAKPPFYARALAYHSDEQLRNHWRHTVAKINKLLGWRKQLDAGLNHQEVVPPNPTRDCSWDCPFYVPCHTAMFDDGSHVDAALEAKFVVGDPYERYELKGVTAA